MPLRGGKAKTLQQKTPLHLIDIHGLIGERLGQTVCDSPVHSQTMFRRIYHLQLRSQAACNSDLGQALEQSQSSMAVWERAAQNHTVRIRKQSSAWPDNKQKQIQRSLRHDTIPRILATNVLASVCAQRERLPRARDKPLASFA